MASRVVAIQKKVKLAHTWLPSVGFWGSWSWFLAVSLQVTWVINPVVGCHYFPPGLQLPSRPVGRYHFAAWWTEAWWVWTVFRGCAWVQHGYRATPLQRTGQNPEDGCEVDDAAVAPASLVVAATHCLTQHPDEQDNDQHDANHLQDERNHGDSTAWYQPRWTHTETDVSVGTQDNSAIAKGCHIEEIRCGHWKMKMRDLVLTHNGIWNFGLDFRTNH